MSHLNDLIRRVSVENPALGAQLADEIRDITNTRRFGLVFEKHKPEAVELPLVAPTTGSTVRILPERGSTAKPDPRLWKVVKVNRSKPRTLDLMAKNAGENMVAQAVPATDVVVVAEFDDTIYPGLRETGQVISTEDTDKPAHAVINGENFHVLQALTFTHRHSIDAIYIDPPYNTGAKDWKYNNDYVVADDDYRHSKWLSFMEKRLLLAKELLNPEDSVLIVTIDEKEYLRLGLLLEQTFPEAKIQMVSSVINPKGTARANEFSRVDEFIFFVMLGDYHLSRNGSDMISDTDVSENTNVRWRGFSRTGRKGLRPVNPGSWYPLYFNQTDDSFHSVGDTVLAGDPIPEPPAGTYAVWPPVRNGEEYSWAMIPSTFRRLHSIGAIHFGKPRKGEGCSISYLTENQLKKIKEGTIVVTGQDKNGSMLVEFASNSKTTAPKTQWNKTSHEGGAYGTNIITDLLAGRRFPFPKSLYAVEDALRFFVKDKPNATILDFFAGSGTTAHAVMRLNKQDGGNRRSISVTNNEVSADEQEDLRKQGLRPGDPEWEQWGICDYITKPRVTAAITGMTPDGDPIKGEYKFTDEFPMTEGFNENARFFTLDYLTPFSVSMGYEFAAIAPLLWMAAGQQGEVISDLGDEGWAVTPSYGVLENTAYARDFVAAIDSNPNALTAFIVTDDDGCFQEVSALVPEHVTVHRLYESYLSNFEINLAKGF